MTIPFFVAPYRPTDWETANSNLRIKPEIYRKQLAEKWPDIAFYESGPTTLLAWGLKVGENARLYGGLQDNQQIVWLDFPHAQFFLWHRTVIPISYPLFLFSTSSWDSLELTSETTFEEVQFFVGARRLG